MSPERRQRIELIFQAALDCEPEKRASFLDQTCGEDADLRREVELLLASDGELGSLFESPAYERLAPLIARDQTQITPGMSISHYDILSRLGAGGMGEVWRARDKHLKRDVAIKLLPSEFAQDADRLRRFEREAQAASALNHPNILTIYEIGSFENTRFIVTELIDGHTLRRQIASGPMKLSEVLKIAVQIAGALAAAHDAGIIHRDIKPENIMVRSDGLVKVLDFGLAKLKPEQVSPISGSESGTSATLTGPGVVMGTVGYMSPEQVRGQNIDHVSDIFSFGVLLYEMLSGQQPFQGESMAETMAAIANEEPPELSGVNGHVPGPLERIVKRCLEKQKERRFQSASDLGFALESLSIPSSLTAKTTSATESRLRLLGKAWLVWCVAGALLLVASIMLVYFQHAPAEVSSTRFTISMPDKVTWHGQPTISPDGRHLAFVATIEGSRMLWVRALDSLEAQVLTGTENAGFPFWSPDSKQIAFFAEGNLKKTKISGELPITLCKIPVVRSQGNSWGRDEMILTLSTEHGLHQVSAESGLVEKLQPHLLGWADYPTLLPDGKHFLYAKAGSRDGSGIYIASLDGRVNRRILPADYSRTAYAMSSDGQGYILLVRQRILIAQPFDATEFRITGEPVRLADNVDPASISVSDNKVLIYQTVGDDSKQQLCWFDRSGKLLGSIGSPAIVKPLAAGHLIPALSPDETHVAVGRLDPNTESTDIWLLDMLRGTETRFTFDQALDNNPVWSPDGSRIVWNSNRKIDVRSDLYYKLSGSRGQDVLLYESKYWKVPLDWSMNGDILFQENTPQTKYDLWILPLEGGGKPYPFLRTPFSEYNARFSPNARWISYVSDESGRIELYVSAFPSDDIKYQISTYGLAATQASRWGRDGNELFYVAPDGNMMAVEIQTSPTFNHSAPRVLFNLKSINALPDHFFMTRDGKRFLLKTILGDASPRPFTVVLNWTSLMPK